MGIATMNPALAFALGLLSGCFVTVLLMLAVTAYLYGVRWGRP